SDVRRSGEHITSQIVNRIKQVIEQNFYISDNQEVQLSKKILYLDQEDNSTLFKKLYELVPTYVEKLLKSKEKFVLEDLYLELIDELSDGNNQTFLDIINDDKNIKEISSLVADKTDIDGDFYVKKSLPHNINYNAIDVATMDPYDFEDLCKQLFEKEGFVNVHRKGGSGDMGVDVVAQQFNGNTKDFWLIQCKRWVGNVDATPLQRLVSERERLGAQQIACYTTSDYTKDAKKVAKAQGVMIINGNELVQKLDKYFKGKYYNSNL
ncbi:restriction endonuclease, partial [Streptococcus mutans]|nr:restriction endonuclease [Streptococcus mutans]